MVIPSFAFVDNSANRWAASHFLAGNTIALIAMSDNKPYKAPNIEDHVVTYYLPQFNNSQYIFVARIDSQTDIYTVTVNGSPVAFNDGSYDLTISADAPIDINIVVADKPTGR